MNIHLSHHVNAKRLPKQLQEYIRKRFILTPEYIKLLGCFEYEGTVGDKQVRRFRIINIKEAERNKFVLKQVGDLDKYPGIVLFEGYIDKTGNAYVADRRAPQRRKIKKVETEK